MDTYIEQLRKRVARLNTFEIDGSYLQVCSYKFEATAVGNALFFVSDYIGEI